MVARNTIIAPVICEQVITLMRRPKRFIIQIHRIESLCRKDSVFLSANDIDGNGNTLL